MDIFLANILLDSDVKFLTCYCIYCMAGALKTEQDIGQRSMRLNTRLTHWSYSKNNLGKIVASVILLVGG